MPVGEDAWAFSWKALAHLTDDGLAAFLLPSMGFPHNHSRSSVEARNAFFLQCRVRRVINFSDLRFQLFEKAHQPAALFIYGPSRKANPSYRFDYWTPKADLNLRIRRVITLSSADKLSFDVSTVIDHPLIFRQWLWMREPDAKLFAFLERLPAIGDFVSEYGDVSRHEGEIAGRWVIGQGYQPLGYDYEGRNKPLDSV